MQLVKEFLKACEASEQKGSEQFGVGAKDDVVENLNLWKEFLQKQPDGQASRNEVETEALELWAHYYKPGVRRKRACDCAASGSCGLARAWTAGATLRTAECAIVSGCRVKVRTLDEEERARIQARVARLGRGG